jgi:hypothetical protein
METIDDWIEPTPIEFDCVGCGRLIIGITMYKMHPRICGACFTHPGWYMFPAMCKALDPFHDRDTAKITLSLAEIECRGAWLGATLNWFHHRVRITEDTEDDSTIQIWKDRPATMTKH